MVRGSVVGFKKKSSPRYGISARLHKLSPTYRRSSRLNNHFKQVKARVIFYSENLEKELEIALVFHPTVPDNDHLYWSFSLTPEPESIGDIYERLVHQSDASQNIFFHRYEDSLFASCAKPTDLAARLCLAVQLTRIARIMLGVSEQDDSSFRVQVLLILKILKKK